MDRKIFLMSKEVLKKDWEVSHIVLTTKSI